MLSDNPPAGQSCTLAGAVTEIDAGQLAAALFEGSPFAQYVVNKDGRITQWNSAATRLLGYESHEVVGALSSMLMPANFLDRWAAAKQSVQQRGSVHVPSVRRHCDGHLIDVDVTASGIGPNTGVAPVYVVTLRDRRREKEYENDNARLAELVRASPLAIVGTDVDRVIRNWNAAAAKLFGYEPCEAIGQNIDLILPTDRSGEIARMSQRVMRGEPVEFETIRWGRGRREIPVRAFGTPRLNSSNVVIGWVLFYEEIGQELAARKALQDAEQFASSVLAANLDWLIVLDESHRVVYSNRDPDGQHSLDPGSDFNGNLWNDLWPKDHTDELGRALAIATADGNSRLTAQRCWRQGPKVWLDISIARLPRTQNEGLRLLVSARDVSLKKKQDDRIANIIKELAHRSKNLLAVILAMTRSTASSCRTAAELDAAISSRIHGLACSHDLLTQEDWSNVDLFSLVRRQLQPFIGPGCAGLSITGVNAYFTPPDAQALGMALHELATNALKYGALSMPDGRVTVSGWPTAVGLRIEWSESGGPAVVEPDARGFGSVVLEDMVAESLGASVQLRFRAEGVVWSLVVPWSRCAGGREGSPVPEAKSIRPSDTQGRV